MAEENYVSPLSTRYASKDMRANFSDINRFRIWRKLWIALAEVEMELGLEVTEGQIRAMKDSADVDLKRAGEFEKELRHDVMAHVHAFGEQVPLARPIIHLGATSCFVTDNSEVIQMKTGLDILIRAVWSCIGSLSEFAMKWKDLPTLGYTHFQAAQPTTVGKRCCLWIQDLLFDALHLESLRDDLRLRGVKGTTGTQASFLALFDGDHEKCRQLDKRVAAKVGFEKTWSVTGQTYTRKQDYHVITALAGIGQSAAKMATDIRLLAHLKEVEEPFEKSQIGSSAMPYKRNPMRCERVCGLARFLQALVLNPAETASTQWLERTLDDSSNRRLATSEAFLTADAIIQLVANISSGLVVHPKVVEKHLNEELPFMATENILMAAVRAGGDRQVLHEVIRKHSIAAGARVKEEGLSNDLLDRIRKDPAFSSIHDKLDETVDAKLFVGRAPEQVMDFVMTEVRPELERRAVDMSFTGEVTV